MRTMWVRGFMAWVAVTACIAWAGPTTAPTSPDALDRVIAQLRATGQPVGIEDLQQAKVPEEQNGAAYLLKAAAQLDKEDSGPRNSNLEYTDQLPYPAEWHRLAETSKQTNAEAFALARKARECKDVRWDGPKSPLPDWIPTGMKGLAGMRALANALTDEALYEHFQGNEQEAMELLRDQQYLTQAVAKRPFLISHLVSTGMHAMAAITVQIMATDLTVADPGESQAEKALEAKQVRAMIRELLDERKMREDYQRAIREERVFALDETRRMGLARIPDWRAKTAAMLGLYSRLIEAADRPVWESIKAEKQDDPFGVVQSLGRANNSWCKTIFANKAAAVGLAGRMYFLKHGRYPEKLEELVPEYLDAVPIDPFSQTGAPVMYRLTEQGKRPVVGSVGVDGVDGKVVEKGLLPEKVSYRVMPVSKEIDDLWIDLTAWQGK